VLTGSEHSEYQHVNHLVCAFGMLATGIAIPAISATTEYHARPLRILTSETGGGTDFAARLIAQKLSATFGKPVVVDNRVAVVAQETAAQAPADGYTLLISSGSIWIAPLLRKMRYDPVRDFAPVALATTSPNVLVVNPSVAASSVRELIALAKAEPGQLNYASGVTGSSSQLAAELFNHMAGVKITRIPYKGGGPAVIDLIGGRVQVMFPNGPSVAPHLKSGKLRPLAVTTARQSPLFPGLPTVAASGVPGYEAALVTAVFAPAYTPQSIIDRLNAEVLRVLKQSDIRETLFNAGMEATGGSPRDLTAEMQADIARLMKVIKAGGIELDR
jgi:tripartite-type tricarboxylate transporter receptor subunit TctC